MQHDWAQLLCARARTRGGSARSRLSSTLLARRLMAGHRSLEPAVVVRIHPGQSPSQAQCDFPRACTSPFDMTSLLSRGRSPELPAGRLDRLSVRVVKPVRGRQARGIGITPGMGARERRFAAGSTSSGPSG